MVVRDRPRLRRGSARRPYPPARDVRTDGRRGRCAAAVSNRARRAGRVHAGCGRTERHPPRPPARHRLLRGDGCQHGGAPARPGATDAGRWEGRRVQIALAVVVVLLFAEGAAAQFTMQVSGDIVIPRDTTHQGTAMTMNGRLIVDGTLRGDAMTMNGDITVSGIVTGDVRTFNGNITLASRAMVGGDVWTANGRVTRAPGAQV